MEEAERNPVYDEAALKMAAKGISSLRRKTLSNGSWGWFGGASERPVMTAHVAHGFKVASNTVNVPMGCFPEPVRWLKTIRKARPLFLRKETNTGNWKNCRRA